MMSYFKALTFVLILQNVFLYVLPSDSCRYCTQHRESCRTVAGIFIVSGLTVGTYNPMLELPARACHINITELAPSKNYIAIKSAGSENILNNYWALSQSGRYPGAGTVFEYYRSAVHANCPGQCVYAAGPTNKKVTVQLLYYSRNPGIKYEFLLPNNIPFQPLEGTYAHIGSKQRPLKPPVINRRTDISQSKFDGEHTGPTFSSRSEGSLLVRSRQQLRSRLHSRRNSSRSVANPNRKRPRSRSHSGSRHVPSPKPDVILRRYGYDDLGGRGLSYSQVRRNGGNLARKIPVVQQTPRYISATNSSRRLIGFETSALQGRRAALSGRTYYRRREKADARSRQNAVTDNDYSVRRRGPVDQGGRAQYEWKISGFTKCSVTCGEGFQETLIICVLKTSRTHVRVTEENCNSKTKPKKQQVKCNTNPCPADWVVGPWSECSVTCGSGTQTRKIECKQRMSRTLHLSVSASLCDDKTKPAVSQMCEKGLCASWKIGAWNQCSVKCGIGERKRKVKCVDHHKKYIPNKYCPRPVPPSVERCDRGPCQTQWWMSAWSDKCPVDCGPGVQTRNVVCTDSRGEKIPESLCELLRKPATQLACHSKKKCDQGQWFAGPWSRCSTDCGNGVRSREIACVKSTTGGLLITQDSDCDTEKKPAATEPCQSGNCGNQWYMTPWSECSVTCGTGRKVRQVKCLDEHQQSSENCDITEKPADQKPCQRKDCKHKSWPQSISTRGSCQDKYRNCKVVVQARLCSYHYYKKICCKSCLSEH